MEKLSYEGEYMELKEFWAKTEPFQSIITHGLVSGTVCRYLMTEYGAALLSDIFAAC